MIPIILSNSEQKLQVSQYQIKKIEPHNKIKLTTFKNLYNFVNSMIIYTIHCREFVNKLDYSI